MSVNGDLDLSAIPGLGPARRAALAEAGVRDLQGLLALRAAELAEVRGIGLWQARKIREFLRQRGLLAEADEEEPAVIKVRAPATREQAEAVAEAAQVLEAQAEIEAVAVAEVERLAQAVAHAMTRGDAESELEEEEEELIQQGSGDPAEELRARRERLPENAMALMEAIREASVSRKLTRQITRLLIAATEFLSSEKPISAEQRRAAAEALKSVDALLQRAVQKEWFSQDAQVELADRIRKQRKALERCLEQGGKAASEEGKEGA